MEKLKERTGKPDKNLAAVCGLFCEACSLYIATREDPARLKKLAAQFGISEEEVKCHGCRSEKRGPYCRICHMAPCAASHGVEFCSSCSEYPCAGLKAFQAERPHRIELWQSLEQVRDRGWECWMADMRRHYACSSCGTHNSAYDSKCRKCGAEPSCGYVALHGEAIQKFLSRH
jgi:hypothetical protein